MFCPKCGNDVDQGSQYCKNCGAALGDDAGQSQNNQGYGSRCVIPMKSSGLAAVLAFLIPGLGHIYLGQIGKGLLYLILEIVLAVIGVLFLIPLIIYAIIWIWQIYDAYRTSEEYNSQLQATGQKPW